MLLLGDPRQVTNILYFTRQEMAFNPRETIRRMLNLPPDEPEALTPPAAPVVPRPHPDVMPAMPPLPPPAPPAAADQREYQPPAPPHAEAGYHWRPVQTAPGFASSRTAVAGIMSAYAAAPLETMSILTPDHNEWEVLLRSVQNRMTEMALPLALSRVEMARHTGSHMTAGVRLFTDDDRTHTILITDSPMRMAYRWEGGPRPELNVPLQAVQNNELPAPAIELPEAFQRPLPPPPAPYAYEPLEHDPDNLDLGVDFARFQDVPLQDIVNNEQVDAMRAAAWIPVALAPGYANERSRAEVRAILGGYSGFTLEDMQLVTAGINGYAAVALVVSRAAGTLLEIDLPQALARPDYRHQPTVRVFTAEDGSSSMLYTEQPMPTVYKWAGPPVEALWPAVEVARARRLVAAGTAVQEPVIDDDQPLIAPGQAPVTHPDGSEIEEEPDGPVF